MVRVPSENTPLKKHLHAFDGQTVRLKKVVPEWKFGKGGPVSVYKCRTQKNPCAQQCYQIILIFSLHFLVCIGPELQGTCPIGVPMSYGLFIESDVYFINGLRIKAYDIRHLKSIGAETLVV